MKMKCLTMIALAAICLTSCITTPHSVTTGTPQLSRELVDKSLINGTTTKADVIALLGEPQSTMSNSTSGPASRFTPAEMWTYTKTFRRDAAEKGFGYAVGYSMLNPASGGYDRLEVSALTISFDAHGRVIAHSFITNSLGARK